MLAARIAVLTALAVLVAPAGAATPTRTVKLPKIGIVFELPATWSGADKDLRFDAHAPKQAALLTIQAVTTKLSLAVLSANFAKVERTQLTKTDPHASVALANVKLGSGKAVKVTIRYRGTWNGKTTSVTHLVYSFKRGTRAYVADFSAGPAFAAHKASFAATVQSLRFLADRQVASASTSRDNWVSHSVKSLAVSFKLPATWTGVTLKPELETFPKDHSAFLRILDALTGQTVDAIGKGFAQDELQTLRKSDPKATVVVDSATLPIGHASKVTMHYRGTWVDHKAEITRVIYFVKKGKRAYEFDFGAAEKYAQNRAVFTRAIKSVRLGGGVSPA